MTERTSWKGSAWRSPRNCTVAIAAVVAMLAVPAVLATPDPTYNLETGEVQRDAVPLKDLVKPINGDTAPSMPFAAANDLCSGAQVIPGAGPFPYLTTTVSLAGNTDAGDPPPPTCIAAGNAAQGAVWYAFTPTQTNTYFFNDCNVQAPGTTHNDTVIAVYSSSDNTCAGTLGQVGCSDDAFACPGLNFLSNASAFLTAGQTYFVVVWNWEAPPATADVQIQVTKSAAPSNDTCVGAANLPLNRTVRGATATLLSATNDYSFADTACYVGLNNNLTGDCLAAGRDVVYTFTAPAAGTYSFRARQLPPGGGGNMALYTADTCPSPGVITCPGGAVASNKNFTATQHAAREEVTCQAMSAGAVKYVIVDECVASTAGGPFTIEAFPCYQEAEPNDTPATAGTAPYAGVSPVEGSTNPGTDVDFFSLGTPPAGSRVFATVDGNSASHFAVPPNPPGADSGDWDLRVTTGTDTLEYDEQDVDSEWGQFAPAIAGRALTGAPSYIRINHRTGLSVGEPYHLYVTVQPPGFDGYGSSASPEVNEGTNDDFPGAETAGNLFWSGTLFNSDDIDFFRVCAAEGDALVFQVDNDPTRTDIVPGRTLITGFSAVTGSQLGPISAINNPGSQTSDTTSGAGSLTATTPFSPSETFLWRAEYSGPHFGYLDMRAFPLLVNGQDYLWMATVNGQNGSEMSSDIQITKTAPDTAPAGGFITYEIELTNNGPSIATFANFFDQMPDGTAFADFTLDGVDDLFGSCSSPPPGDVGGSVSCTFDCLPAGRTVTITITVQVFQCIGEGFGVSNTIFAGTVTNLAPESVTEANHVTTITDDGSCEADGDACTVDSCVDGVCTAGGPPDCNDTNPCTDDACDSEDGCVYTNNTNPCEDGNACTAGDVCGDGACNPGTPVDPNDNNPCTDDSCDPDTGVHNDPNTNPCDDGNACTSGDACGGGSCQPGGPLGCDDGNPCTDQACDPGTGCVYTNNTAPCDDGDPSTSNDTCSGGICVGEADECEPGARPRVVGYYHSLCNGPHSGDELTAADAACVAGLSDTFSDVTSVADICAALHTTGSDKCLKAEESLMAMALNICKGKVCSDQSIASSCSSYDTVGDSFAAADAALAASGRTEATCDAAGCQAKEVNNGKALELNSLAISHVAGEIRLDWEIPLLDNPNQLHGYRIWRRVVGSLAPFTQIGTTETPHFVDPTGLTGNFEYEIQAY